MKKMAIDNQQMENHLTMHQIINSILQMNKDVKDWWWKRRKYYTKYDKRYFHIQYLIIMENVVIVA